MDAYPKWLGFFTCIWLIACANTKPFEKIEHRKIQKGRTTYEEVVKMFGEPKQTIQGSNGKKLIVYSHMDIDASAGRILFGSWVKDQGDLEVKRLDILLDSKGRVEKYHFTETATPVTAAIDEASVGKVISPEQVAKIKKGTTRKTDLKAWLGPPNEEGLTTEGNLVQYWWYAEQKMFDNDQFQSLAVILKNDVVDDYAIGKRTPDAE